MTTPKKKHLIELMIEANIKWPDDAEYATQDKSTYKVHFYKGRKPVRSKTNNEAWSDAVSTCIWMGREISIELPSLCGNWHQTIVTREQYEQALAAQQNEHSVCSKDVIKTISNVTLDMLLNQVQLKTIKQKELTTQIELLSQDIFNLENIIIEKLSQYGFVMSIMKQIQDITWEDLQEGDVVECIKSTHNEINQGDRGVVIGKSMNTIWIDFYIQASCEYHRQHFNSMFKFISRP